MKYYYFKNINTGATIRIQHTSARSAWNVLCYEYGREYAEKTFCVA